MTVNTPKTTVVMSATADYAFAVANVLMGLKKHSPRLADRVVLYNQGFSENDRRALSSILPCEFVDYTADKLKGYHESDHFKRVTSATFATCEIFDHLERSDYVIYLDCDLMILGDISGILDYAAPVAMRLFVQNKPGALEEMLGANHEGRTLPDYEGNAGVVAVSRQADYSGLKELLYQKAIQYSPTNKRGDQTIFNLGFFLKGISICDLPSEYNQLGFYAPFNPDAKILHQVHTEKFWNNGFAHFLAPAWAQNYARWLELGGTPYEGEKRFWEFTAFEEAPLFKLMGMAKIYRAAIEDFLERLGQKLAYAVDEFFVKDYTLSLRKNETTIVSCNIFDKYVTICVKTQVHGPEITELAAANGFHFENGQWIWAERLSESLFTNMDKLEKNIRYAIYLAEGAQKCYAV